MVDLNDVWFLKDVFEYVSDQVTLVQEPVTTRISQCPYHKKWISQCPYFGINIWHAVKENYMVCAGTIFGSVKNVNVFLKEFVEMLQKTQCNDQGVLNVMFWTQNFSSIPRLQTHEEGVVQSLNVAQLFDISNAVVIHTGDNEKNKKIISPYIQAYKQVVKFHNVLTPTEDKKSIHLLLRVLDILTLENIEYTLTGGCLIGVELYSRRIPWDDDMDIYIMMEHKTQAMTRLKEHNLSIEPSYNSLYHKVWENRIETTDNKQRHNWPFIDIGWLVSNESHAWELRTAEKRYQHHIFPRNFIFPVKSALFEGHIVFIPANSENILSITYGNHWKTTCVMSNWDHKFEKVRYPELGDGQTQIRMPCEDVMRVHSKDLFHVLGN